MPVQPPSDQFAGFDDQQTDTSAPTRTYRRGGSRKGLVIGTIVTLAVIGIGALCVHLVLRNSGDGEGLFGPDYKGPVLKVIKEHLNDTEGFEVVKWGEPRKILMGKSPSPGKARVWIPAYVVYIKFRAKNKLGAKVLDDATFLVLDGKDAKPIPNHMVNQIETLSPGGSFEEDGVMVKLAR
jgi:hypothetical protein